MSDPFITLADISVRLPEKLFLENTSWQIKSDEHWAILGPNGSGKSTLMKALIGTIPIVKGTIIRHFEQTDNDTKIPGYNPIGYVSSELHREIIEREFLVNRFRDFSSKIDEITTVREIIVEGIRNYALDDGEKEKRLSEIAARMELTDLLEKSITAISSGEMHEALIARALIRKPKLLILDEPFEGLDRKSQSFLAEIINEMMVDQMRVILITHRFVEIMPNITNVLYLREGQIYKFGKKEEVFNRRIIDEVYSTDQGTIKKLIASFEKNKQAVVKENLDNQRSKQEVADSDLIRMTDVSVTYGKIIVLNKINWVMRTGQNWALLGPGESGKTTLLKLITGDNLQAYANDIHLFGRRKGSGESIWEIKQKLGYVSSDLRMEYPGNVILYDVVCSGFFDSRGIYRVCNIEQLAIARKWIKIFGLESLAEKPYRQLSSGQKQLAVIARAMVKSPRILILDEPCEGLDIANREMVLQVVEYIGNCTSSHLIYTTSDDEEILPCITHILNLPAGISVPASPSPS